MPYICIIQLPYKHCWWKYVILRINNNHFACRGITTIKVSLSKKNSQVTRLSELEFWHTPGCAFKNTVLA